jgi:erythronate-4-phosphate dehydrogenase
MRAKMKIIADQNIPLAKELFAEFGEITSLPGREITAKDIDNADILLVRSVTNVNRELLLSNTTVKFIGSCTIGIDHLDTDYLSDANVAWANAPGCNANAVVQYVLTAMAIAQPRWLEKTIGIIGCGNVGGRLYKCLTALGVKCICYDPLLTAAADLTRVDLDDLLTQADIISCHVPLTTDGDYPSLHMLGKKEFAMIKDNALLINSGRGAVIDTVALGQEIDKRSLRGKKLSIVLDVWENEPLVDHALLDKITLGSPHIAGYSIEGREQGTFMIYQALCRFLMQPESAAAHAQLTTDKKAVMTHSVFDQTTLNDSDKALENFNRLLLSCYNSTRDHQALCHVDNFDGLRKNYPARREYSHFVLPEDFDNAQIRHWFNTIKLTVI